MEHNTAKESDCPLDLSGWEPEAIIARWREAYVRASGEAPYSAIYGRGWFRLQGRLTQSSIVCRRREAAEMIWRLENRPKWAVPLPATNADDIKERIGG
jgi:hypothetical protein